MILRNAIARWICLVGVLSSTTQAMGADDVKTTFQDGKEAGLIFQLQGEYSGAFKSDEGEMKIGVQVVADGTEKLTWAAYIGGLPGDGWDGNTPLRGEGVVEGNTGVLKGDTGRGEIRDGSLVVYSQDNNRVGELAKTIRVSSTQGRKPPEDAVVLFDGTTADKFEGGRLTDDKLLMQGVTSHEKFQSYELHVEFRLPFMPHAKGQGRGNSGCYLQGRYEVQMLDSFGLTGEDNECGGIYEIRKPDMNMCFPPLSWQTYDIEYHAAKYDEAGKKTKDAGMTVKLNGKTIHQKVELPRGTRAAPVAEGPDAGPVYLQDHGDPIRYQNIWVRPLKD